MSLTELLDQAIRLYRKNFLQFVGIIAIVQIPLTLLSLIASLVTMGGTVSRLESGYVPSEDPFETFGAGYWIGLAGTLVVGILSYVLLQGIATGALTRAVADRYLGQSTDFIEAYVKIGSLWLRIIGALLLIILVGIGLVIWWIVPCVGWLTGIGILFFWTAAVSPLVAPIVVLEQKKPGAAVRRAWDLTRRRFWWVVGYVGLLFLLNQLIVSGPGALINVIFQALMESMVGSAGLSDAFTISTITQTLVSLVASLIYVPLQLTGMVLMYFDLRVRTEGFDLTLLTQSTSGEDGASDVVAQAPDGKVTGLVTGKEMGYFLLLSLIAFAVYFVLGMIGAVLSGLAAVLFSGASGL
jgi:hypothetical protein